jgi:hypothetical protein
MLRLGYTVIDIATPAAALTCWESGQPRAEITAFAHQHNLTYIPVRNGQQITGIITREALHNGAEPMRLTADWLIAADTPILELIELLAHQPDRVFLVLQASRIVGLTAPADLNKIPARASVYLLIAEFEAELARLIRRVLPDDAQLEPYFSADRWARLQAEKRRAANRDIELDLLHHMYISDLVLIARKNDQIRAALGFANSTQAKNALKFKTLRDAVSHPTSPLVAARSELPELHARCHRLLELNQRMAALGSQGSPTVGCQSPSSG